MSTIVFLWSTTWNQTHEWCLHNICKVSSDLPSSESTVPAVCSDESPTFLIRALGALWSMYISDSNIGLNCRIHRTLVHLILTFVASRSFLNLVLAWSFARALLRAPTRVAGPSSVVVGKETCCLSFNKTIRLGTHCSSLHMPALQSCLHLRSPISQDSSYRTISSNLHSYSKKKGSNHKRIYFLSITEKACWSTQRASLTKTSRDTCRAVACTKSQQCKQSIPKWVHNSIKSNHKNLYESPLLFQITKISINLKTFFSWPICFGNLSGCFFSRATSLKIFRVYGLSNIESFEVEEIKVTGIECTY